MLLVLIFNKLCLRDLWHNCISFIHSVEVIFINANVFTYEQELDIGGLKDVYVGNIIYVHNELRYTLVPRITSR